MNCCPLVWTVYITTHLQRFQRSKGIYCSSNLLLMPSTFKATKELFNLQCTCAAHTLKDSYLVKEQKLVTICHKCQCIHCSSSTSSGSSFITPLHLPSDHSNIHEFHIIQDPHFLVFWLTGSTCTDRRVLFLQTHCLLCKGGWSDQKGNRQR